MSFDEATDFAQRTLIEYVLEAVNGSMSKAAVWLCEHRVGIYRLCKRLGIDYKKFRKKGEKLDT